MYKAPRVLPSPPACLPHSCWHLCSSHCVPHHYCRWAFAHFINLRCTFLLSLALFIFIPFLYSSKKSEEYLPQESLASIPQIQPNLSCIFVYSKATQQAAMKLQRQTGISIYLFYSWASGSAGQCCWSEISLPEYIHVSVVSCVLTRQLCWSSLGYLTCPGPWPGQLGWLHLAPCSPSSRLAQAWSHDGRQRNQKEGCLTKLLES